MGCHTWFVRPVTEEELNVFKENAIKDAWELFGETEINKLYNIVKLDIYNKVKESVENNTNFWCTGEYGTFGTNIYDENGEVIASECVFEKNGMLYLDLADNVNNIFDLHRYHDLFRVYSYPRKKIHSRRELRRWMGKKYFDLTQEQLEEISRFFRENKGGFICFG